MTAIANLPDDQFWGLVGILVIVAAWVGTAVGSW